MDPGFDYKRNYIVKNEEVDVSNGPESGRNLVATSTRKEAA
jgi:hypothetical protein